jgi:succinoglycan biosynthesis transport protein ExoP
MAADVGHLPYRCRIVGVSSCIPNEGKTTIAANLAQLMAGGRSRVLLIDADLRNPMLSRTIAPDAKRGLADALRNPAMLPQLVLQHAECATLDFLPVTNSRQPEDSYETLTSEQMRTLIAEHTGDYQYIVLDLPPLAPVVDVRAASHLFDGLVLVTRWGTTTTSIIKKVLEASAGFNDKLLGAVLNCVNVTQLKQYENLDELYYNNKYYIQEDRVIEQAG